MNKFKLAIMMLAMVPMTIVGTVSAGTLSFMPYAFDSKMKCVQGANGSYTHKGALANSFDWVKAEGSSLGFPTLSPGAATVVKAVDAYPDTGPLEVRKKHNAGGGNTVTLFDPVTNKYIRVMHCKKGSVAVKVGDNVSGGDKICEIGNSGHSTNAHTHFQMMNSINGSTVPFSFVETNPKCDGKDFIRFAKNLKNASVLDNDGSTNFGNEFAFTKVIPGFGTWASNAYPTGADYNGLDYRWTKVTFPGKENYSWIFSPKTSGVYKIAVNLPGLNPGRDQFALYQFNGLNKVVNQTKADNVGEDAWIPLFDDVTLIAGKTYTMTLRGMTPGKTIGADAVILLRK